MRLATDEKRRHDPLHGRPQLRERNHSRVSEDFSVYGVVHEPDDLQIRQGQGKMHRSGWGKPDTRSLCIVLCCPSAIAGFFDTSLIVPKNW